MIGVGGGVTRLSDAGGGPSIRDQMAEPRWDTTLPAAFRHRTEMGPTSISANPDFDFGRDMEVAKGSDG